MGSPALPSTFVKGFHDETRVKKIKYNMLGKTNLMVSNLSLGTGGFSHFYGNYSIEECKKIVEEALKSGINYIDTGPWYGHGVAETILGKCLDVIPRKAYYVASKVGRYEADPKLMFDFSAKKTRDSVETTMKKLGLQYIDIMQVHDVEFAPSLDIILNETLPTLQEFVDDGKIGSIGLTGYPNNVMKEIIEKSDINIDMILSYTRLTMIDQSLREYLPFYKQNNIGVVNASAHAMGLLTNGGPQPWHPASEKTKKICKEAAQFCKENNIELGRLALFYALQQEGPSTTLFGTNSKEILRMNLDVNQFGLNENELKVYREVLKKNFNGIGQTHWEGVELKKFKEKL